MSKERLSTASGILLITGCILATIGLVTCILALTLPYWVYLSVTLETTVAGLTDDTHVEYYYGLRRYCLTMLATHLDRSDCGNRDWAEPNDWESVTFYTLVLTSCMLLVTVITTLANLLCWNKLRLLVVAVVTSFIAGVTSAVGVSMYQIRFSVLVLDIGGLTTTKFQPEYFSHCFWLGFASSALSTTSSITLLIGTFSWRRPQPKNTKVHGFPYSTTVHRQQCPHTGRTPATISVTHM